MKLTYHYSTDKTMITIVGEGDFTEISIADILLSIATQVKENETVQDR